MDEELVADRLVELRGQTKQLRTRRDELTLALDGEPTTPEEATLVEIANCITEIINTGSHNTRKGLVEALVASVIATGPDRLRPVFRIPDTTNHYEAASALPADTAPKGTVRTMTNLVELRGIEPLTFSMRTRRATNCATAPWSGESISVALIASARPLRLGYSPTARR